MTVRFLRRLWSDTSFFERLTAKYRAEVLTRRDLFAMRAVKASLLCLLLAAVCSLDFYLDGVNILPDTLAALFLALSVIFIRRFGGKTLPALAVSIAYGLAAALSWVYQFKQFRSDELEDVLRSDAVHARWQIALCLKAVAAILFVAAVILILRILYTMVKRYTGFHAFRDGSAYAAERTEAIHKLIQKKLIRVGVFGVLTVLSTLLFWGVIPILPEWELHYADANAQTQNVIDTLVNTAYLLLTDGYWFIDLCVGGLWIAAIGSATGEIADQMEYSSMMR
jgi:hypothetical protein